MNHILAWVNENRNCCGCNSGSVKLDNNQNLGQCACRYFGRILDTEGSA